MWIFFFLKNHVRNDSVFFLSQCWKHNRDTSKMGHLYFMEV